MNLDAPNGTEVLRVKRPEDVPEFDYWVHDAYLEDGLRFSAESARAVVPFAQESGWGDRHPSMPDPDLVRQTPLARHYEVPLTRCYLVVEHATALDSDIDWGNPTLTAVHFDATGATLTLDSSVSIGVSGVDIRVLVSVEEAGRLYRKVLRGWPIESDRWLSRPR
jgi:hypothetical protein